MCYVNVDTIVESGVDDSMSQFNPRTNNDDILVRSAGDETSIQATLSATIAESSLCPSLSEQQQT